MYLRNKAIEIGVGRTLDIKRSPADVVNGFIVKKNGNISVFQ